MLIHVFIQTTLHVCLFDLLKANEYKFIQHSMQAYVGFAH